MNTTKTLTATVAIIAATSLTACGSAKTASGSTTINKASALSCAKTLRPLGGIGKIGLGVAKQTVKPADALNQLKPYQATLAKIGTDNASNALGAAITKLTADITDLQKNQPKDATSAKAAFATLSTDAKAITSACLGG